MYSIINKILFDDPFCITSPNMDDLLFGNNDDTGDNYDEEEEDNDEEGNMEVITNREKVDLKNDKEIDEYCETHYVPLYEVTNPKYLCDDARSGIRGNCLNATIEIDKDIISHLNSALNSTGLTDTRNLATDKNQKVVRKIYSTLFKDGAEAKLVFLDTKSSIYKPIVIIEKKENECTRIYRMTDDEESFDSSLKGLSYMGTRTRFEEKNSHCYEKEEFDNIYHFWSFIESTLYNLTIKCV